MNIETQTQQTTEDEILGQINDPSLQTEENNEGSQSSQEQTTDDQTSTQQQSSEQGTDTSDQTQQQQQQQGTGGPQDLLDAQGNVVAKGGADRRHYENWQREQLKTRSLATELDTARKTIETYERASNLTREYNLTPEELASGAQMINAWKTQPGELVKYLLTQAQAAGHNVEVGSTDASAMRQAVEQVLQPVLADIQQRSDTQTAEQQAAKEYGDFLSVHPDAKVHGNSIARILENDDNITLEGAFYKLQNFYLQRGLDWTKPLEELTKQAATQQTQQTTQKPMPSGTSGSDQNVSDVNEVADSADASYDEIIRNAMS